MGYFESNRWNGTPVSMPESMKSVFYYTYNWLLDTLTGLLPRPKCSELWGVLFQRRRLTYRTLLKTTCFLFRTSSQRQIPCVLVFSHWGSISDPFLMILGCNACTLQGLAGGFGSSPDKLTMARNSLLEGLQGRIKKISDTYCCKPLSLPKY